MRTEKRNCNFCNKELLITRSDQLKKKHNYCDVSCYNKSTKRKYVDGYRQCKNPECSTQFPYRNSLKVRSVRCHHTGLLVGFKDQMFCGKKCSMYFRNKYENPSKNDEVKEKIREFAKKHSVFKKHKPEWIEKRRQTIMGENHWNWQGGKTNETRKIRNSYEYRLWREAVFKRDKYTCQNCGIKNGNGKAIILNADHIKPFAFYPDLRFDVNNGKTLCLECHKKTDTFAKKKIS